MTTKTKKQVPDDVERRLLGGELNVSTTTLADVLPDAAKSAFDVYGIAATMPGSARRIMAFMDALNGCLQFRRENPKLYDAIYEANAEVEELRFCKNIAVEDEMPPIFSGLLADFYGIRTRAGTGKEDCGMTIKAFAERCGVSIRTVKNWNAGKSPPTVFIPTLQAQVTYSQKLLDNPIEAGRFALLYKEHRRIKRAEREKVSYRGEETDRMNERKKRGIPPSTQQREADYNGVASDSDSARRLGYQSSISSSWGT